MKLKSILILLSSGAVLLCAGCNMSSTVQPRTDSVAEEATVATTAPPVVKNYSSYEEFASEFKEKKPSAYQLEIPESQDELKVTKAAFSDINYVLSCENTEGQQLKVTVEYEMTGCETIEALKIANGGTAGSSVIEETETYFIRKNKDGSMILYTLAGENNTVCTIFAESCDKETLLETMESLGL